MRANQGSLKLSATIGFDKCGGESAKSSGDSIVGIGVGGQSINHGTGGGNASKCGGIKGDGGVVAGDCDHVFDGYGTCADDY